MGIQNGAIIWEIYLGIFKRSNKGLPSDPTNTSPGKMKLYDPHKISYIGKLMY